MLGGFLSTPGLEGHELKVQSASFLSYWHSSLCRLEALIYDLTLSLPLEWGGLNFSEILAPGQGDAVKASENTGLQVQIQITPS